jgi:hypothetical protein
VCTGRKASLISFGSRGEVASAAIGGGLNRSAPLIIDRTGVWMLRDPQVWPWATPILIPDVTFADVASQYHDLLGGLEDSGLAVPHAGLRGR